ncbi:MAG: YciI family protein [Cellvibrionaceae bacterium]
MFIISLTYVKELAEVDKHIEAHVAYLEKYYAENIFMVSGRKVPRTGGLIMAKAPNKEAVEKIIEEDPFFQAQVAKYDITEFVPTMAAPELKALVS